MIYAHEEAELTCYDMASLGDLEKRVKINEKSVEAQGKKLAFIEGKLSAPASTKTPHPWTTPLVSAGAVGLLGFWGWVGITLVQHGNAGWYSPVDAITWNNCGGK